MTKSFSCSVIKSFLMAITLICATAQVRATSSWSGPIITVEVVSQSGTDTLKIDRTILLNPYSFLASWEIPTGGPSGSVDFYFGMLSPDSKTVYTWVRQDGGYVLVKGLRPINEGVNLNTPGTYRTSEIGGGGVRYTVMGSEEPGMYLVFALVVGGGRTPTDVSNWVEVEMKPLFIR